jgi:aminoglycoside phosphotransferase (APT) family kinase protein
MTEGVDLERLRPWFTEHVAALGDADPLDATLIAGGRSNLTYRLAAGDRSWVLRRPPLGHVLESAHDMGREFRVLSALADTEVAVPRVFAHCADADVLGAPFYVMEHVHGVVMGISELQQLDATDAARCSNALVDVLVALHAVDYEAHGLGDFGRPDGFVARNVARWYKQWDANATRPLPAIDELGRRLPGAVPESGPPSVVHGDYRIDNTMLAVDDPGRIVAVLDWEMSTIGDPLTDLGLFVVYWGDLWNSVAMGMPNLASVPGFGSSNDMVRRYAEQSGRSVDGLDFYVVFALFKVAIILEGIHKRFLLGKTVGEGFDTIGPAVATLADAALELADASDDPRLVE